MNKDNLREVLQEEARTVAKDNRYLLLAWATRVGKTPAALKIIADNPGRWNIVVAETVHIKQWEEEFDKFGLLSLLPDINIFCYESIHKHQEENINWVFDEAHHIFGEKRWEIINNISTFKRALFLTATMYNDEIDILKSKFFPLKVHKVTLRDAIRKHILPTPDILVIPYDLNEEDQTEIVILEKGIPKLRKIVYTTYEKRYEVLRKYPHVTLKASATERQKYDWYTDQMTYYKDKYSQERVEWMKNKWLHLGSERKRFVASTKTALTQQLLTYLIDKRYICFTGSIDQCLKLGRENTVFSKKSSKENNAILSSFNRKKINHLFAVSMLTEGVNLFDIDAGIIVQLDGKTRSYIQRSGRIFLGKYPQQYIIYARNTQDEKYLDNTFSRIEGKYVYYLDNIYDFFEQ